MKVAYVATLALVGLLAPGIVVAQETEGAKPEKAKRQLEEVVVTAQKREEFSHDVPISMSVMSETFIKDQGLTNVADALRFVPNFKVVEYLNTITPQCRGFVVSQGNAAFEPPCGLALDGVAFNRAAYFSSGLFDLKRMEVLRGPQGTTFGKNTTAGVISLYSKDPTEEYAANIDLQKGVEGADVRRVELGVGGPLISDVVHFRLAGMKEEREGYMENTYHKTDPSVSETIGDSERSAWRAKLLFPDLLGAKIKLLTERTTVLSQGNLAKTTEVQHESQRQYIRQYDPHYDFGENYKSSGFGGSFGDIELTRHHGEVSFGVGDWDVTLLGATGEMTYHLFIQATLYPQDFVDLDQKESNPYRTAELRIDSPDFEGLFGLQNLFGLDLGSSRVLAGIFSQKTELDVSTFVSLNYAPLPGIIAASTGTFVPDKLLVDAAAEQERQTGSQPGESYTEVGHQTAESEAIFGQFTWDMTEQWSLDLSGRYGRETKTADWDLSFSEPAALLNPAGNRQFTTKKSRSEAVFQPKISVKFALTDTINLFAHWARAYKGGGFNFNAASGNPEEADPTRSSAQEGSLSFEPEVGEDWGIDFKSVLLDNTLRLNVSLFRLTVDDFQVLVTVPGSEIPTTNVRVPNGFKEVRNSGKARAQGAEIDMQYLPTSWLTVMGSLGYNDTEYLKFTDDSCALNEAADPETGRCDHTGKPFLGSPTLNSTLSLDARLPLAGIWDGFGDLIFQLGGSVEYTSDYPTTAYGDCCVQEAHYLYRAQTGLASPSQGWSLRVTGLNLTNEYITPNIGSDPANKSVGPRPPRSVFAQFNWIY